MPREQEQQQQEEEQFDPSYDLPAAPQVKKKVTEIYSSQQCRATHQARMLQGILAAASTTLPLELEPATDRYSEKASASKLYL